MAKKTKDYEATLPGKFLVDEVGCKICHCRFHRSTHLGRKSIIYEDNDNTAGLTQISQSFLILIVVFNFAVLRIKSR
jgi:hypothetical protein